VHFPDESYVRLYTRKTLTSRKLKWEGRAVLRAMLDEFDRAGIFELGGDDAVECIAAVTEIPVEIVRVGLERLLATKTWTLTPRALVWPTYVEAQTCAKSDRIRQRESRERRAATAIADHQPARSMEDAGSASNVTNGHAPSHGVTPSLAEPNSPDLNSTRDHAHAHAHARESETPPADEVEPEPPEGEPGHLPRFERFPPGWRWSPATSAVATAHAVPSDKLEGHVRYWTTHPFPQRVCDLDGELQRMIVEGTIGPPSKSGTAAPAPLRPDDWRPDDAARRFARERPWMDLDWAAAAYRGAGTPERIGSHLKAHGDFMARLKWWAQHGEFLPSGMPPRPVKAVNT
jgi:hypothetical protein